MAPLDEEQPLLAKPAAGPVGRKALFVALALGFSLGVVAGVAGVTMNKVETETSLDNFRPETGQSCVVCIDYCNGVGGFGCGGVCGNGGGVIGPAPVAESPAPAPKPTIEGVSSLLDTLATAAVYDIPFEFPAITVNKIHGKVHDFLRTELERSHVFDYHMAEMELRSPQIQSLVDQLVKDMVASETSSLVDELADEYVTNLTLVGALPSKATLPGLFEMVRREVAGLLMHKVEVLEFTGIVSKGKLMDELRSPVIQNFFHPIVDMVAGGHWDRVFDPEGVLDFADILAGTYVAEKVAMGLVPPDSFLEDYVRRFVQWFLRRKVVPGISYGNQGKGDLYDEWNSLEFRHELEIKVQSVFPEVAPGAGN